MAAVKLPDPKNPEQSKWGYINKNGDLVIQPQFDNVEPFKDGIARVRFLNYGRMNMAEGYINKDGEYIWKPT